ncbi:MAG: DUF3857 domain-containing protein [Gammaproteobacteria bacterium]|nr:DUF3857 domain-containing protein [Gammaproteobacteria bacterium]
MQGNPTAVPKEIKRFFPSLERVCTLLITSLCIFGVVDAWAVEYESNGYKYSVSARPAWVQDLDIKDSPHSSKNNQGYSLRYRLFDRQVRYNQSGAGEYYYHLALQPLAHSMLEESSQFTIEYNPDYQKLVIHEINVLRGKQKFNQLLEENIKLIQREEELEKKIYDGRVSALVVLKNVRVGDVIEYSYTLTGDNPVFAGKISQWFGMGWSYPMDRQYLRIVTPKNKTLYTYNHLLEGVETVEVTDLEKVRVWDMKNTEGLRVDSQTPPWYEPYPAVQLTEFEDWRSVSRWSAGLYKFDQKLGDSLENKLEEWSAKKLSDADLAVEALQFVQREVRYFGVEMGQNSHRPTDPETVMKRRYGDCKDKTLMLVSLLRRMNVKAYPALVSSDIQSGISAWKPAPNIFDHVITAVDIKGKLYFLDPTRSQQYGSIETLGSKRYGKYLLVDDKISVDLVEDSATEGSLASTDVQEYYFVEDYDSPVDMVVTSRFSGVESDRQRAFFEENPLDLIQNEYINFYISRYEDIEISRDMVTYDDKANNVFTVVEFYHLPQVWEKEDGEITFTAYAEIIKQYSAMPKDKRRQSPLYVNYPATIKKEVSVSFPNNIEMQLSNTDLKLEDKHVRFDRNISSVGNLFRVKYSYEAKKDHVLQPDVREHIKLLGNINKNLYYTLAMKLPVQLGKKKANPSVQYLLNELEMISGK